MALTYIQVAAKNDFKNSVNLYVNCVAVCVVKLLVLRRLQKIKPPGKDFSSPGGLVSIKKTDQ
jgi:hypothetical protein